MAADSDADMEVAEVTDSEEERNREAEEAGIENLQSKLLISNVRKYFLKDKCILFFHKKRIYSAVRTAKWTLTERINFTQAEHQKP